VGSPRLVARPMQAMVSGYRVRKPFTEKPFAQTARWMFFAEIRSGRFVTPRDLVESAAIDLIESGYHERLVKRAAQSLLQPWIVSCNMNAKNRPQAAFGPDRGRITATRYRM
jgi:hypothetical protein